jgi:hypothetical protein
LILFSRHIVFPILPELIGIVSKTAYPAGLERQDYLTHSCQEKIFLALVPLGRHTRAAIAARDKCLPCKDSCLTGR